MYRTTAETVALYFSVQVLKICQLKI